ncbi:MAG: conjugal transfer protein TraX [Lachnospiraceae bacterium]|nr:conjugal transfer protein TraX [Lachnospiraceae bacterium]
MEEKRGWSGSTLKMIAIITMLIDHIGAVILERGILVKVSGQSVLSADIAALHAYNKWQMIDRIFRSIGRLAFPIFCFLLIEGFLHTRDWRKYFIRLFLFSFLSEIPFDFAVYGKAFCWYSQNVYFTLWIGLLVITGIRYIEEREEIAEGLKKLLQILTVIAGIGLAEWMRTDYAGFGVFAIAGLYFLRSNKKVQTAFGCISFAWEITAPLAFIPIYKYNGTRGWNLKYVFYVFYPVHLLILGLIVKFAF